MKSKKFLALFLAVIMLATVGLTACNGGGGASSTPPAAADDTAAADDAAVTDEEDDGADVTQSKYTGTEYPEGTPVTLWSQNFGEKWVNHFSEQVHQYNLEGRGYTITEEYIAGDAWDERMNAARASLTAPDAYVQSYNHVPNGVRNEYYAPLDDYMDAAILDRMFPIIRSMVTIGGKTYAIPLLAEPSQVLYYRKDLLEAAGYTAPPKTWAELIEMANACKTDEIYGIGVPNWGGEISWSTWGMQYGNIGHGPVNDNWDAPTIDDGYRDFALFFKELYDTGAVPEQPLSGYTDIKPMGQGDYVFQICGSWACAALINDYPEMWPNVGVAVMPTKDGNQEKTTATIGGWIYVLDSKSEAPEGVADYFSWMLDADHPERLGAFHVAELFGKAAPFDNVAAWVEEQAPADADYVEVINKISSYGQPEAAYLWDISMAVDRMVESVTMGYEDIDSALQTCRDDIQKLIDDNQTAGTNPRN